MMKLRKMNKAGAITLFCALTTLSASAQKSFKYKAALQKIDSTGFYRISLQPGLIAKAKPDLSDIRIADAKGNFIPYIQAGSLPQKSQKSFAVFPQVKSLAADTGTTFTVENKTGLVLDRLWIKLQNTAVKRKVNLLGSDDLQQWFAIQEDIPLQEAVLNSEGTYVQSLSFPASNYRYLKIQVNDKNKTPIRFLLAGVYTEYALAQNYTPISPVQMSRVDSNKTTYITLKLEDNYQVNKLHLNIRAPKYYKRGIEVYQLANKHRELIAETELNADKSTDLLINAKAPQLQLEISNGDNPPLTIKSVDAYQSDQYLISYLEKGQIYQFIVGDSTAQAPEYDLKFFADSIRENIPQIAHDSVVKNGIYQQQSIKVKKDYTLFIWLAILLALGSLLFLTLKMTKEVNKKSGDDKVE